jgi:hypothetical protein
VNADLRRAGPAGAPAPRNTISVALLAGVAFMPIVVAVGFMTDRPNGASVPGDISVAALRGALDGIPGERHPPARAGF